MSKDTNNSNSGTYEYLLEEGDYDDDERDLNNNNNNNNINTNSSDKNYFQKNYGRKAGAILASSLGSLNSGTSSMRKKTNNNNNNGGGGNKMVQFDIQLPTKPTSIYDRDENVGFYDDDEDEYADLTSNMFLDDEQLFNTNYSTKRCLYRLLSYLRPQFWYYMFAFIALGITTLCQLLLPYYFAQQIEQTVDKMVFNDKFFETYPTVNKTEIKEQYDINGLQLFDWFESSKYLLFIIIIQIPFTFIRYVLFTIAGFNFVTKIKADLFKSLLAQEIAYFDQSKSPELNAILSSDTLLLQNIVTVSLSTLARCLLQSAGGLLILLFLSWRTTIFIASFLALFFLGYLVFKAFIHPKYKYIQELYTRASSVVDNAITNITEIRLLNAESKELRSFETELETIYRTSKSSTIINGFWIAIGGFSVLILMISTFLFIIYQSLYQDMKIFQYILYTLMLIISSSGVFGVIGDFQKIISSSRRVFSLIDRRPLVSFQGGVVPSSDTNQAITFDSVSFHHKNGAVLLNNVSFVVEKKSIISIVGPSTSVTKDIVFSLIQGLYYPTRGSVLIGRVDSKAIDLHYFRSKLYSITSNTVIFEGTVEQNIRYGLSHLSTQNIIEACKRAHLHDFIIGLPHGYDSMIGKGERLAPVHIQKISLARAFLRDPAILLIDESSCMLDSGNELLEPLEQLMQFRTVIIQANRIDTLIRSNHILVFDESRLVEQGNHKSLISNSDSIYSTFVLKHFSQSN